MTVNGLQLPPELIELMESDRWRVPPGADLKEWERVLRHGGLSRDGTSQVRFFSIEEMEEKTRELKKHAYPENFMPSLGNRSMVNHAVAYDPTRCIAIADLMHVPDNPHFLIVPVVLDFQRYANEPRVIYYPDDALELYWCEIAANVEDFADMLKL